MQTYYPDRAPSDASAEPSEFIHCTDVESSVREFVETHYSDYVELYTSMQNGLHGFYTSVRELAELLEYIMGRRLCGGNIRIEMIEKGGTLTITIDSDECDASVLGGDLTLAVLATHAGLGVETDGDRLVLYVDVVMSGKGIVCAVARTYLLYHLEAAYQRTRAEKEQKEGQ